MMQFNKGNVLSLIVGMVLGIILSFFLANSGKLPITDLERKLTAKADSLMVAGKTRETTARRKEMQWQHIVDSLKLVVALKPKPKTVYKRIDEKINASVRVLTDVQLDSILTNYRHKPISEEGSR